MKILRGLSEIAEFRGGFFSIGNFDGVHLGHRSMLSVLTGRARPLKTAAVVFTFDPHPIALLRPGQIPPPLTTTERKLELLAECGVDATLVYPTDQPLLDLVPREFFDRIVVGRLAAQGLVEGPNFFFGHNRAGSVDTLREYCRGANLELHVAEPVFVKDVLVSSTEIRRRIALGDVRTAAELLGAPYQVRGTVGEGARRGRTLGFPTANLSGVETVLPRDGVYAGRARLARTSDRWQPAAINVGPNPTFAEHQRKLEVHLLDFSGDLYGRLLDVEFIERLRDTRPFSGPEELKHQLDRDVRRVREVAGSLAREHPPSG